MFEEMSPEEIEGLERSFDRVMKRKAERQTEMPAEELILEPGEDKLLDEYIRERVQRKRRAKTPPKGI